MGALVWTLGAAGLYAVVPFQLSRLGLIPLLTVAYLFPLPLLLGLVAVFRARRARRSPLLLLGDPLGLRIARVGGRLGAAAIYLGVTVGLADGFFWLLTTSSYR